MKSEQKNSKYLISSFNGFIGAASIHVYLKLSISEIFIISFNYQKRFSFEKDTVYEQGWI